MTTRHQSIRFSSRLLRYWGDRIRDRGGRDGRLCILTYHRVLSRPDPILASEPDLDTFKWQMELLGECFNVLPLYEAIARLSEQTLPARAVCVTFDDGYRSTHDFALPILKSLGLPATVFVASGFADGASMWNDRIIDSTRRFDGNVLNLTKLGLGAHPFRTNKERRHAIHAVTEALKYRAPEERLNLAARIEKITGVAAVRGPMLSSDQISSMAQQGIEIGGHTVTHPILANLSDEMARDEIVQNKQKLEAITHKPVRLFAYPNGKPHVDFNERHTQMVKDAGYAAAVTTQIGAATRAHDPFLLPRSRPWDTSPIRFGIRLLYWLAGKN